MLLGENFLSVQTTYLIELGRAGQFRRLEISVRLMFVNELNLLHILKAHNDSYQVLIKW